MLRPAALLLAVSVAFPAFSLAQDPSTPPPQFEVVSIKHTVGLPNDGGMRTSPDGSFTMTNSAIRQIIRSAAPEPVSEVVGLPDWANTERYDLIAKAPQGSTRAQQGQMMRQMFIERMKLEGHIEQQERNTFAMVLARRDGRLGPQLKPSSLDCSNPAAQARPTPDAPGCGTLMASRTIVAGAMSMEQLAASLGGRVGGQIFDRTGLEGRYSLTLRFGPPLGPGTNPSPDDAPDIFTALQEQLGLKLEPEKSMVPIFVIDHLERPTEN